MSAERSQGMKWRQAIVDFLGLKSKLRLAKIVHGADVKADRDADSVSTGLEAIAVGYSLRFPDDSENLERQFDVYDALYAWCWLQVAKEG